MGDKIDERTESRVCISGEPQITAWIFLFAYFPALSFLGFFESFFSPSESYGHFAFFLVGIRSIVDFRTFPEGERLADPVGYPTRDETRAS